MQHLEHRCGNLALVREHAVRNSEQLVEMLRGYITELKNEKKRIKGAILDSNNKKELLERYGHAMVLIEE